MLLLGVLFALQERISVSHLSMHIGLTLLLQAWCVEYLLWGLLFWLVWFLIGPWLQRVGWVGMLTAVLPFSVAMSVLEEAVWVACFPNIPIRHHVMTYWQRLTFQLTAELINGIVIFWCIYLLFRGIDYYLRFLEKQDAAAQLEGQLAQAQLTALRMHLNPHFLFNTLNNISSLMQTDVAGADLMLEQFSSLLRITLERGEVQLIPLCDEMEFVEMYMAMQDRRFSGRIRQEVRIAPELHDALVPAMILQPIVENAYAHGLSRLEGKGDISIEARREKNRLRIMITNSGIGLDQHRARHTSHKGLGLRNASDRLRLHYREDQSFNIREISRGTVQVTLTMPLQLAPNPNDKRPAYGA